MMSAVAGQVLTGPPGGAVERYQGNCIGGTTWVENQHDNAFVQHRSGMIYSHDKDVEDPFTNVVIYHKGNFLFRVPSTSFTHNPSDLIPVGWFRQGGTSTNYTVSITNNGTVDAEGNMGWKLCNWTGCYGGVRLQGEWDWW